jgi:hypothetical protein
MVPKVQLGDGLKVGTDSMEGFRQSSVVFGCEMASAGRSGVRARRSRILRNGALPDAVDEQVALGV